LADESRESFRRNSEKLVDIKLEFVQTPENAFDCVFDLNALHRPILSELCLKLGIVNIRILQRLQRLALGLVPLLRKSEEDVVRDVLSSLALFVWCFYDKSGAAPAFDYVKALNVNRYVEIEHSKDNSEERAWNRLLREYGYLHTNDIDLLLINYVERGYLDAEALSIQLSERNEASQREAGRQYHRDVWNLYLNSFDDNEEEFVRALIEGFRAKMAHLTLNELDQTVVTLRKFDRDEAANHLVGEYLALHRDELSKLKSTAGLVFPLRDAQLAQRLDELISAIPKARDLSEIVKRITVTHSFHPDDITFLANAPIEDYYTFFRTERSPELRSYVKQCLEFGRDATSEQGKLIARKATDALRSLASESRINRVRAEVLYGISLHDDNPSEVESPKERLDSEKKASREAGENEVANLPDLRELPEETTGS
jgi:hypothetical protein